jgi:hypothetical protein
MTAQILWGVERAIPRIALAKESPARRWTQRVLLLASRSPLQEFSKLAKISSMAMRPKASEKGEWALAT